MKKVQVQTLAFMYMDQEKWFLLFEPQPLRLLSGSRITSSCLYCVEKAMATHSSTLAWEIPWMEEPGRLQSIGTQRVGHDFTFTFTHFNRLQYSVNVTFPMYSQYIGKFMGLASLQSSPYCGCLEPNQWYSRVLAWFWLSSVIVRVIQGRLCWVPTCVALTRDTVMNEIDRVPQGVC